MSSFTDALENAVLDFITNAAAFTLYTPGVTTLYLRLSSTVPNDDGSNWTEQTGTGYAAQSLTGKWAAASGRSKPTGADVSYTASGADWTQINAVGVWTHPTAGTMIAWDQVTAKSIGNGETYTVASGNLILSVNASLTGAGQGGWRTTFVTQLLNWLMEGTAFSGAYTNVGAADPYVAIFPDGSEASDGSDGTELTGTNYVRKQTSFNAAGGDGVTENPSDVNFTCSTPDDYGSLGGLALCVGGTKTTADLMWCGNLNTVATINLDDTLKIQAGSIVLTVT